MDKTQSNAFNMFESVASTMNSFDTVWAANGVISAIVTNLQSGLSALLGGQQNQTAGSKGVTQTKSQARTILEGTAMAVASAGKAYAVSDNNLVLKETCSLTASGLDKAKDVDLIAICQNLYDAVNPFAASLAPYGATSTSLSALQTAITTFTALTGKPASAIAAVSAATEGIEIEVKAIKTLLNEQLDPLMMQFKTSNPAFYNQYMASRVIHDIGIRHTVTFKGFIYSAGNVALPGALVKLAGAALHEKITGTTGAYEFTRLHTGTYIFQISAAGFVSQTKTIVVTENGTVETNFILVAAAISS